MVSLTTFPSDNSSLDKQRFCSVIFFMGSPRICIYYCANLPSLCPWLQITKRFSIKKTLSGHPSSFLQLNPIQFPISPNYQSKNRKKASSYGKLKSIQVFIRLVVLISEKKFHLLTTPCNCPLSNRELGLNQIELYFTHRIDLSCVRSYSRFINVQFADYITYFELLRKLNVVRNKT